ncbi:MAG: transposase, partial [Bacillota bacterium]|nr:transposase [Bacillota bacterium]
MWTDERIRGHFVMCFIALCMVRYLQYLLEHKTGVRPSAAVLQKSLISPLVLMQGEWPSVTLTPTNISQTYLDLVEALELP